MHLKQALRIRRIVWYARDPPLGHAAANLSYEILRNRTVRTQLRCINGKPYISNIVTYLCYCTK